MKKTIIIAVVLIIAVAAFVWYIRNKKPSLVSFDNLTKMGTYRFQGKTTTIDLRTTGARVGGYTITPILLEVNVQNLPIGSIIGMALRKDGVIVDKITA